MLISNYEYFCNMIDGKLSVETY